MLHFCCLSLSADYLWEVAELPELVRDCDDRALTECVAPAVAVA